MKVRFSQEAPKKRITELLADRPSMMTSVEYASTPINFHHQRSKSHEYDCLSKVQNTFGIDSLKTVSRRARNMSQKEDEALSPKFKFESAEDQLRQRIIQKDQLIDELQLQLSGLLKTMQAEINAVRNESAKIVEQQMRQIDIYQKQLQDCRSEINEYYQQKRQCDRIFRVCHCRQLERENQALLSKVDQLRQQLECDHSIENQISVIEKCDITQFEKTFKWLADELNLSQQMNCSTDLVEGVKTWKQQSKDNQKFIASLRDLVIQCNPSQREPSLKEIWRFIKDILSSYMDNKRCADQIQMISKYLDCEPTQVCHRTAILVVDTEVHARILEKIKSIFRINVNNPRDIERCLDKYL